MYFQYFARPSILTSLGSQSVQCSCSAAVEPICHVAKQALLALACSSMQVYKYSYKIIESTRMKVLSDH